MICITICGIELAVDFTLPATLALLLLILPQNDVAATIFACLLHELAHFLTLIWYKRKPTQLRISGIGMRLAIPQTALCPMRELAVILLSGVAANFIASASFLYLSKPFSAMTNCTLALFNLLPYRSTDGGTLLFAILEHFLTPQCPDKIRKTWRMIWISATFSILMLCGILRLWSVSLAAMLSFLCIMEVLVDF